jgi:hypothetical protein
MGNDGVNYQCKPWESLNAKLKQKMGKRTRDSTGCFTTSIEDAWPKWLQKNFPINGIMCSCRNVFLTHSAYCKEHGLYECSFLPEFRNQGEIGLKHILAKCTWIFSAQIHC